MNRREVLRTAAVGLGSVALLPLASSSFETLALAGSGSWKAVADAAAHCIKVGEVCAKHCEEMIAKGSKDMQACHTTVMDMLAACGAMQKLAAQGSKHAPAFAKACSAVLADCIKACEPHKDMKECLDCATACKECEKACANAA